MKKFKLLAVVMCAALALSSVALFAGCTPKDSGKITIGIITSPSGIDDGSFNQSAYEAIQKYQSEKGGKDKVEIIHKQQQSEAWANIKPDIINLAQRCDYVVCPGFQFSGINEVADTYTDVQFILIDTMPNEARDNIASFTFAEQEAGFLAGVAAGMQTATGKVGFVGGLSYPSVNNYGYGFCAGVKYASDKNLAASGVTLTLPSFTVPEIGQSISNAVNVGYADSFNDVTKGKTIGDNLYNAGCDILFVAAGNSGNGAFNSAKELNKYVIGCDVNQYKDGVNGSKNIVLTSALKRVDNAVYMALTSFKKGHSVLNAAADGVGFVSESGSHQLTETTISKLNEVFGLIKSGKIVPSTEGCTYTEKA